MNYRTHIAGGVALGYVVYNNVGMLSDYINDSSTFVIATAGLAIGSLFPDIDISGSYLSRRLRLLSFFTSKLFKHRGFTHSIVGVGTFSIFLIFIMKMLGFSHSVTQLFSFSFMVGMISHVLLDLITWKGVTLFYPYSKRIHLGGFRSNLMSSPLSELLIGLALVVVAYKNMLELM